jgi:hypothetical protein
LQSLNGRDEPQPFQPIRFVIYGESIVSDWNNPVATTSRAICLALAELGHEVVFQEERRNRPTVDLLKARGYGPVRDFAKALPAVVYRTYEIPPPREQGVWLGREATTADVMIVLGDVPAEVIDGLRSLDLPFLVTLFEDPTESSSSEILLRALHDPQLSVPFGPAVAQEVVRNSDRTEPSTLLVAYDDADLAREVAAQIDDVNTRLVVAGTASLPEWEFVPEIALPKLYRSAMTVAVIGAGQGRGSEGRALLPLAHDCKVIAVEADGVLEVGNGLIRATPESMRTALEPSALDSKDANAFTLPKDYRALTIAQRLVEIPKRVDSPLLP